MSEQNIRIVQLPAIRVASAHAFGPQPEYEALEKLKGWAKSKGYLEPPQAPRIFGFNNPNPSVGSPNYGYEVWLVVGPETQPEQGIEIKDFPGGKYAVLRWDGQGDPNETIPVAWMELVKWCDGNTYQCAGHQCMEEHLPPVEGSQVEFMLDLYLPIA